MKNIIVFFMALMPLMANAQYIKKGYHGFVDGGYAAYISQIAPSTIEVTTSHGYQFNPYIFLGGGVGVDITGDCKWGEVGGMAYNKRESSVDIPVFFNFRSNFTKTRVSPFFDARVGAYVNNDGGIYLNAALGCRCAVSNNVGISLSVGYEMRKVTVDQLEMMNGGRYNYYMYYSERQDNTVDGFVIKAGLDF